jgi:hypothetical protein
MGILDPKGDEEIDSVIVQQNEISAQGRRGQALLFDYQPMAPTHSAHAFIGCLSTFKGRIVHALLPRCMSRGSSKP